MTDPDKTPIYRVQEFAEMAGLTVRALHHYDRLGLLKPGRSQAGYRLYCLEDLQRLEQIVALKAALKELKVKSEVEVYAGTEHGFAFPARAAYNKQAAETHWERLHSLFRRNIG